MSSEETVKSEWGFKEPHRARSYYRSLSQQNRLGRQCSVVRGKRKTLCLGSLCLDRREKMNQSLLSPRYVRMRKGGEAGSRGTHHCSKTSRSVNHQVSPWADGRNTVGGNFREQLLGMTAQSTWLSNTNFTVPYVERREPVSMGWGKQQKKAVWRTAVWGLDAEREASAHSWSRLVSRAPGEEAEEHSAVTLRPRVPHLGEWSMLEYIWWRLRQNRLRLQGQKNGHQLKDFTERRDRTPREKPAAVT